MKNGRGFSLIETLLATVILVSGLVTIAHIFSYSIATNINNRQLTEATILLIEKLEQFKSAALSDSAWATGGSLNPVSPTPGFFDYVSVGNDGGLAVSTGSSPYLRLWQISGTVPRSITVIVYATRAGLSRNRMELIRAATMKSSTF